ncbi:DUF7286 family protein [Haloprofundus salilacus]|uniref:DUF7286 family protein n=1 Tax=Haloprofundus salilacus TaxID=2876190 RepID=UPI001CCCD245|nr:hypothetical protein [Haloprofundus salilacus]
MADRARLAARAAYFERVLARPDSRAVWTAERYDRLGETLADRGATASSPSELGRLVETAEGAVVPEPRTFGDDAPASDVALHPDGSPAYLTLGSVERTHAPMILPNASYRPLAARNTNLVTVPYGDVVDHALKGSKRVSLRTGGQVLVVANRTAAATGNETLDERRQRLGSEVADGVDVTKDVARTTLERETALSATEHRAAVERGFDRWDGHGQRALAAVNGSAATAIAEEVGKRRDWTSGPSRFAGYTRSSLSPRGAARLDRPTSGTSVTATR